MDRAYVYSLEPGSLPVGAQVGRQAETCAEVVKAKTPPFTGDDRPQPTATPELKMSHMN
jgi:hypothetical protein